MEHCKFLGITLPGHSLPICSGKADVQQLIMPRRGQSESKQYKPEMVEAICNHCLATMKDAHSSRGSSLELVAVYTEIALVEKFHAISLGNGEGMNLRQGLCSRKECANSLPHIGIQAIQFQGEAFPICHRCKHASMIAAIKHTDMRLFPGPIADVFIAARKNQQRQQDKLAKRTNPNAAQIAAEEKLRKEETQRQADEAARKVAEEKREQELKQRDERFVFMFDCFPRTSDITPITPAPTPKKKGPADLRVVGSLEDRRRGTRS